MNILFIACYSPFINNSASIRTLYYLNNLVDIEGNSVTLLTVDFPKDSVYFDEYILSMLDKRVKVHSISGGKLFNKVMPRKVQGVVEKINGNKIQNSNREKIKRIIKSMKNTLVSPDMYYSWSKRASEYMVKLMAKENFQVIFSMHEPPSSHLCALRIKKCFKDIPWVQYYSDPWVRDPNRSSMPNLRKLREEKMEKEVVSMGDKFVFVSEGNRDEFIKLYNIPKENTYLVQRGFDINKYEEILKDNPPEGVKKNCINMVHTGEIFTKLRDVRPFIMALKELQKKNISLYNKLNIMFYGNIDDESIKSQLESVDKITVKKRVPYKEALAYMIHSEVLILLGNKNSNQIPGKIYDYYGTRNNIFVILGDEKDPVKSVTQGVEKCTVVNNNSEDILRGLNQVIKKVQDNRDSEPIMEYEWKNVTYKLNGILQEAARCM
ncbi:hypothetical protein SAMN02745248_02127 [Hathewaya proteolytica DSM 3090]|uniref:Glycosyltransferase subfamily 4-like N-terminal domain-containing protein n=1 Tax=Hathewaya proteolytica DSM 3090 TaxID=1121331 RepID=A0A1M6QTZ2_9CLOT|nr:glycosyltransferase [Hathewaya proteolytica]SHK23789.1 hypothetical protein SAMN02745248_02127 [Hathewaya proteolytica DSM 3090]